MIKFVGLFQEDENFNLSLLDWGAQKRKMYMMNVMADEEKIHCIPQRTDNYAFARPHAPTKEALI